MVIDVGVVLEVRRLVNVKVMQALALLAVDACRGVRGDHLASSRFPLPCCSRYHILLARL